jgi:uncharacterized surface protein with fasciclin (FAS1) repeats
MLDAAALAFQILPTTHAPLRLTTPSTTCLRSLPPPTAAGKAPHRSLRQAAADPETTFATPLAAAVAASDNLSTLIRLVQLANLTAPLNSTTTAWTIFAPTNAAFEAALTTLGITAAELVEDPATLAVRGRREGGVGIMRRHAGGGRVLLGC